MNILRTAIFALVALTATLLFMPQTVQAKEYSYSASGSSFIDFGYPGGMGYEDGGSTEVFDLGFNLGGGVDMLGCAGVTLEGFLTAFANLEHVFKNFLNNIKKAFFRRLLVEAFSRMPQIGALFDTINAMGNARFEMFNESCDITSVRADAKALMEKRCIESGNTEYECNPATADNGIFKGIKKTVNKQLANFHKKMQNIGGVTRSAICDETSTSGMCAVMSFLPQMTLCWNVGVPGYDTHSGCKSSRTQSAVVGVDALYNSSFNMSHTAASSSLDAVLKLARNKSLEELRIQEQATPDISLAAQVSNKASPSKSMYAEGPFHLALVDFDYDLADIAKYSDDANTKKLEKDLKSFMNCSNSNPTALVEAIVKNAGYSVTIDKPKASDLISLPPGTLDQALTLAKADAGGALKLVETAIGCTMNHALLLNFRTQLALTQVSPETRKSYLAAYSNKVSNLATENLLRFLRNELLNAYAKLSGSNPSTETQKTALNSSSTGSGDLSVDGWDESENIANTPEPTLEAIKSMADMIEEQIKTLQRISKEQTALSEMNNELNNLLAY